MLKPIHILAIAALLICGIVTARAAESPRHYSVHVFKTGSAGLRTGNEIVAMTQTRDGYLWLGTLHGLARFDGLQFKVFDQNNTPGLRTEGVIKLFEDSRGTLWAGADNADVLMIKDGRATSLGFLKGGADPRLRVVCEDSTGAVWLYTADGSLCRFSGNTVNVWRIPGEQRNITRTMAADKAGLVWVGTDTQLFGIDPKGAFTTNAPPVAAGYNLTNKLDYLLASQQGGYWCLAGGHVTNRLGKDFGPYPWKQSLVLCACEDREGNLIVGTFNSGIYWFDAGGNVTHVGSGDGLSHDTILSVCVDREDNLWAGTDGGGLNRVKHQVFDTLDETVGRTVQSAFADVSGGLWVGFAGAGVKYYKGATNQSYEPPGVDWYMQSVFVDRDQGVWAWGRKLPEPDSVLFRLQDNAFRPFFHSGDVTRGGAALYQDRQGLIWAGAQGGLAYWNGRELKTYTTRDGLASDAVRAIVGDVDGNLWIGTGTGLNCFRDGKFTTFRELDGLPSEDISSLYADDTGALWIGSRGKGLTRFYHGHWTHYSTGNGLTSNSIGYLIEDEQGFLWIGSPAGLMRVRKKDLNDVANGFAKEVSCRTFEEPDGLQTGECTMGSQPGACRTPDGKLWFPTIKGLAVVDPREILFNTNPPPVLIESILIDDQPQNTNGLGGKLPLRVVVPADKESLDIRYTSLNLATADKARFRYQLLGFDAKAIETDSTTRYAHYNKLPAGEYQFRVTACNEDGVWNPASATLALTVLPPFWRQLWFIGVVAVCLLGAIVGIVHYFSTQRLQHQLEGFRQQQALERERSRIARDIHDQLGASLTQVSLLGEMVESDKNVPDEVEAHARQISQTARDTSRVLDEIVWTVNPSNDTLDGLVNYVCKYAQEYLAVAGVRYRLDVPSDLPTTEISPEVRHNVFLAAKESVTNVVRHAKATEVWLRLKLEPGKFILEIQDNGRGVNLEGKQSRNGLRNLHKRMEDVGGTFSLTSPPEGGALVRLTVPLGNQT